MPNQLEHRVNADTEPTLPNLQTATFTTTPAPAMDLARRVGLALAILTTEEDPDIRRAHAVQALLTGCVEDRATLA